MAETFTIQELVRYFEDRCRRGDRAGLGPAAGKEPQYPMLVVFLGRDAIKSYPAVASGLFRLWPQYQDELRFVGVELEDNAAVYTRLTREDGQVRRTKLPDGELSAVVTALFGLRNHFPDRSKLLVYYVLDTTELADADMYSRWLEVLRDTKALLGVDELDELDLLILLLNEDFSRRKLARRLRNRISGYYEDPAPGACSGVFLLSNRRSDNAILEDWEVCCRVISAVIALSNNSDAKVCGTLFGHSIMTASYAREEKPLGAVGQIVVKALIGELAGSGQTQEAVQMDSDTLSQRLGLARDGTPEIFRRCAEETLAPMLPTPEQLELFPRRDEGDYGDLADYSQREFNELTMNAWDCYLSQLAGEARERAAADVSARQSWESEYAAGLRERCSTSELAYLSSHLDEARRLLGRKREPSPDAPVLSAATERLTYMLTSDETLTRLLLDTVKAQGEKASGFLNAWNELLRSRLSMFAVRDENISRFYERRVRKYFDYHGLELIQRFQKIRDMEELRRFLENTLDDIIDGDDIYTSAFEEELERRLREEALPVDAKQYIRQKLTGDGVHTYFQAMFSFDQPLLSAILLKMGTPLSGSLRRNLPEETYFYDTGYGDAAESLVIYEVGKHNLISEEEP